jgi:hypothetical protein
MKTQIYRRICATLMVLTTITFATPAQAETVKRCDKYDALLRKHGLPVRTFSYLMWRESRCQPRAIGWNFKQGKSHRNCKLAKASEYRKCAAVDSYDSGLLQINSTWRTVTAQVCGSKWGDMTVLLEPKCNLRVARYLYDNGGLVHWGRA